MATSQQAIANKANAARSTGPKTGGGNALNPGLQSSTRLLLHDATPPPDLDALRDALSGELRPSTALRHTLFNLIVSKFWRLMRISRIETDILQSEVIEDRYQFIPSYGPDGIDEPGTGAVLGRAFQRTVRDREQLAHVQKYETSLERGMLRLLDKYDELQARQAV